MLALALILDAILGEPKWLWDRAPHPAVVMGDAVDYADENWNEGTMRRARGALVLAAFVAVTVVVAALLSVIPLFEILGAAILLAHRSLIDHVRAVATALRQGLPQGREAVALIVGRDPDALDESGVARAAIESAAENFSDGVVAPAFWFAVAGLPGIAVYKLVNTADSMIGHRTPRHAEFGWAAARLDDALNWIPARLTALIFALAGGGRDAWRVAARDARHHRSVNAGWPEAALASTLGIRLAEPRLYDGKLSDDLPMNPEGRGTLGPADIDGAVRLLWRAWGVVLAVALVLGVVL